MGGALSTANANNSSFPSYREVIPVVERGMGLAANNANCDRAANLAATQIRTVAALTNRSDCPPSQVTIINNFGSGQIYVNNPPGEACEVPPRTGGAGFASISGAFCSPDSLLNFDLMNTLGFDVMNRAVVILISQGVIWSFYHIIHQYFHSIDYNFTNSNYLSHNYSLEEEIFQNLNQLDS